MLKRLFLCFGLVLLLTCDDGDIITVDLEFDRVLVRCDNDDNSFFIFDVREDPSEVIGIVLPISESLIFEQATQPDDLPRIINGSTIRFIYRTYNRNVDDSDNNELCDVVPPADLVILEDYESATGTIEILTTIEDDDDDGVPTIFENRGDPDENGNFPNAQDTDNDGIPDYIDKDDDGDNVPTSFEIDSNDGDSDPNTNPLDTDSDGIPNYLDDDDDDDGVNTRLEDENGDQNPRNDTNTNPDGVIVPHYLNSLESISYDDSGPNPGDDWRSYLRIVTTNFTVRNFDLQIILGDEYNLGTYESRITERPD